MTPQNSLKPVAKDFASKLARRGDYKVIVFRTSSQPPSQRLRRVQPLPLMVLMVAICPVSLICQAPKAAAAKHLSAAAQGFQNKLDYLERNARSNPVQRRPTQINAEEVNAWFREGGYTLPRGVQTVTFHSRADTINAHATVDFDAVKEGKRNLNPLLSIFSGVHEVQVTASASAQNGQGRVTIESVSMDGVGVPHMALELFVNRYLKPKYPNVGLDNNFKMPDRIDTATIGNDSAVLTQK
jgi:hypothetical protein